MAPTDEQIAGRLGILFVERVALAARCTLIQFPPDLDTGIDGFVEFPAPDGARLLAIQVKRGSAYFDGHGARYQAQVKHLRSWVQYALSVILIVVAEDESSAFWLDVTRYASAVPDILEGQSHVLRPVNPFGVESLKGPLTLVARKTDFREALGMLVSERPQVRSHALSLLYRFRTERITPFTVAAAIRVEDDPRTMGRLCDFFSRYLSRSGRAFGDLPSEIGAYAGTLLEAVPLRALLTMLDVFELDDELRIWWEQHVDDSTSEEAWRTHLAFTGPTVQQAIASVVRVAADSRRLLDVLSDPMIAIARRRAAAALFMQLRYTCDLKVLDGIALQEDDALLGALLFWVRHSLLTERA